MSVRHPVDLVTPDYYAQELGYQKQIDQRNRTSQLADRARVRYDVTNRLVCIELPLEHARRRPAGLIELYRPSAARQDRQFRLDVDANGRQSIETSTLTAGLWRARVNWQVDGGDFTLESRIVIPAAMPN